MTTYRPARQAKVRDRRLVEYAARNRGNEITFTVLRVPKQPETELTLTGTCLGTVRAPFHGTSTAPWLLVDVKQKGEDGRPYRVRCIFPASTVRHIEEL